MDFCAVSEDRKLYLIQCTMKTGRFFADEIQLTHLGLPDSVPDAGQARHVFMCQSVKP